MKPRAERQLSLPHLPTEQGESAMRAAYRSARIRIPFELAVRDTALKICLRCFAEARQRRGR
jgi:hypothetical protein